MNSPKTEVKRKYEDDSIPESISLSMEEEHENNSLPERKTRTPVNDFAEAENSSSETPYPHSRHDYSQCKSIFTFYLLFVVSSHASDKKAFEACE